MNDYKEYFGKWTKNLLPDDNDAFQDLKIAEEFNYGALIMKRIVSTQKPYLEELSSIYKIVDPKFLKFNQKGVVFDKYEPRYMDFLKKLDFFDKQQNALQVKSQKSASPKRRNIKLDLSSFRSNRVGSHFKL